MSDTPNTGPSHEALRNLAGMMPSFIKGLKKNKILGKGTPALIRRPRKVCKVCGLLYDHAMLPGTAELEIKPEFCATCKPLLDDGYTALVCGDKYALVKSANLPDWAGQIVHVSPNVMEAVEKQHSVNKLRINGSTRPTDTEPAE